MSLDAVQRKIHKDIAAQGYATVKAPKWYYTVGLGLQGRKDLICPATIPFASFLVLASNYATGEIAPEGKVVVRDLKVTTKAMGPENARFELCQLQEKDSAVFHEQLCNQARIQEFTGFMVVRTPDDDNRLFGEDECKYISSPEEFLRDIVFDLSKEIEKKRLNDLADRAHAQKVLSKKITPRNKPKKHAKKRK